MALRATSFSRRVTSRHRTVWRTLLPPIVTAGIVALLSAPSASAVTVLEVPDGTKTPTVKIVNPSNGDRYLLDQSDLKTTAAYGCITKTVVPPCLPIPLIGIAFVDIDPLSSGFDNFIKGASASTPGAILPGMKVPTDTLGNHVLVAAGFDPDEGDPAQMGFVVEANAYAVDPPVYRDLITADHPIAYWRLNDGLGAPTMSDYTDQHDGRYMNHVALGREPAPNCADPTRATYGCNHANDSDPLVDDTSAGSAYFNGIDSYASVDNFTLPYGAYTVEAWVKPDGTSDSSTMGILQHGSGGMLAIKAGHLIFNPSSNNQSPVLTSSKSLSELKSNDGWYWVIGTWDGTTARLYVNGQPDGSATGVTGLGPSTSTFYVGRVNTLPLFRGNIAEVAYYDKAITDADTIADEWETATYVEPPAVALASVPSVPGTGVCPNPLAPAVSGCWALDTTPPKISSNIVDGGTYNPNSPKNPTIKADCTDADGPVADPLPYTPAGCMPGTAVNVPVAGSICLPWPSTSLDTSPGKHELTFCGYDREVVASLADLPPGIPNNIVSKTISYTMMPYADIIRSDKPVAYFGLGDAPNSMVMADLSGNHHDGAYKNDTLTGGTGVTGPGDTSRKFLGAGGYGFANGIPAPPYAYTMEAWVKPADDGDMMILEQGGAGALSIKNGQLVFHYGEVDVTGPAPKPGQWTFVAATYDGSHLRLYERASSAGNPDSSDNMLVAGPQFAYRSQVEVPSGSATFYVGYGDQVHTNTPWYRGEIDEVAYFPTALSSERLYEHWLADPAPVAPPWPGSKPRAVSPPTISGIATTGSRLAASTGTWTGNRPMSFSYQWQRCKRTCSKIVGATGRFYRPTVADVGARLRVLVTARNRRGSSQAVSRPVGPVKKPSNHFTVAAVNVHGDGSVEFDVTVPGPGQLDVLETAWNPLVRAFSDSAALSRLQPGPNRFAFARQSLRPAGAGTVHVKVLPSTEGRRVVRRHDKPLHINLWITYQPTGGNPRNAAFLNLFVAD